MILTAFVNTELYNTIEDIKSKTSYRIDDGSSELAARDFSNRIKNRQNVSLIQKWLTLKNQ